VELYKDYSADYSDPAEETEKTETEKTETEKTETENPEPENPGPETSGASTNSSDIEISANKQGMLRKK
jgi:hypothetical protein